MCREMRKGEDEILERMNRKDKRMSGDGRQKRLEGG
jgi:hypothetical protein